MKDLQALINVTVNELGYELIDFESAGNGLLRVHIDCFDNVQRINARDCEVVAHRLNQVLQDECVDYEKLIVLSPRVNRPLKTFAHFKRFEERVIVIKLLTPFQGRKQHEGKLHITEEGGLGIELAPQEKDAASQLLSFEFSEIESAHLKPCREGNYRFFDFVVYRKHSMKAYHDYVFRFIDYFVCFCLLFGWLVVAWRIISYPVNHWGVNLKVALPALLILIIFYGMRILLLSKQRSLRVFCIVVGLLVSIGGISCLDHHHVLMYYEDWIKSGMPDRAF